MSSGNDHQQVAFVAVLATTVAQVGCVTVFVILGALVVGLALDRTFDTRPLFTLLLVLASIPVSLYLLVQVALSGAAQLTPPTPKEEEKESSDEKE